MKNTMNTTTAAEKINAQQAQAMRKEQIEKIIKINGSFSAILDPQSVTGYGNISTAYPHVTVWKTREGFFEVILETYSEWDTWYDYFGERRYICSPGKWTDDEGYHYFSTPTGFNEKAKEYVENLLNILSAE